MLLRSRQSSQPLKVALVHEFLLRLGGAERVLEVLSTIFPEAPIYTLLYDEKKCGSVFPKKRIKTSALQKCYQWGGPHRFLVGQMSTAIENFDFQDYDLVISSSSAFAHGLIPPLWGKHLCYCHSPMRYAWDYAEEYRQELPFFIRSFVKRLQHKLRPWDKIAARRADVIIANSLLVQERIKKYWDLDSTVIYPPVDIARFSIQSSAEDYFLIVSQLTPFKKIDLAIQAFNQHPHLSFQIIGSGREEARLRKMARKNITFLGRLSDREVTAKMQHCRALIFPGEEDFGITPVEAMACGRPVLAYGRGGVLETVIAGKTGEFFEESTAASLSSGLQRLIEHEKNYDPQFIRAQAENFSQVKFIEQIQVLITKTLEQ